MARNSDLPEGIEPLNHSVRVFAAMVGIGKSSAWAHVKAGHIKVVYFGRIPKVPASETARIAVEGLPKINATRPK